MICSNKKKNRRFHYSEQNVGFAKENQRVQVSPSKCFDYSDTISTEINMHV
jgi:hypothetical protein